MCENMSDCPFYQGREHLSRNIDKLYRMKYCMNNKANCARYMLATAIGKEKVPRSLYPNMNKMAKLLISEMSSCKSLG